MHAVEMFEERCFWLSVIRSCITTYTACFIATVRLLPERVTQQCYPRIS